MGEVTISGSDALCLEHTISHTGAHSRATLTAQQRRSSLGTAQARFTGTTSKAMTPTSSPHSALAITRWWRPCAGAQLDGAPALTAPEPTATPGLGKPANGRSTGTWRHE